MPRRDWVQVPDLTDTAAIREFLAWVQESIIALKAQTPTLPAPTRVTGDAGGLHEAIKVEWDEISGARNYNVFLTDNPALPGVLSPAAKVPANPATTRGAYLAKGITAGSTRYVAVQATDINGKEGAISAFRGPIVTLI